MPVSCTYQEKSITAKPALCMRHPLGTKQDAFKFLKMNQFKKKQQENCTAGGSEIERAVFTQHPAVPGAVPALCQLAQQEQLGGHGQTLIHRLRGVVRKGGGETQGSSGVCWGVQHKEPPAAHRP